MGALSASAGTPQVLRMLRPASQTKTASAPANSSRPAGTESLGPFPEKGVSLAKDGVPRASRRDPGPSASPPPCAQHRSPRAPPGPPRCRPASRACRFQRTQGPPRRPKRTPKPPDHVPRRTLIPTRVPPRGLDSRRFQEPPPPPPLPPPPLARRGGEGMWRGPALTPPPLRPGTRPGPRRRERRAQSPTPGRPPRTGQPLLGVACWLHLQITSRAGYPGRCPGWKPCALDPGGRAFQCPRTRSPPAFLFLKFGGKEERCPPKDSGPPSFANDPSKGPVVRVAEYPKAGGGRARARRVSRT